MTDMAEVRPSTGCDIYQWLREVCSAKLVATVIRLGGAGVIVQIDESLFRRKPKVAHNNIYCKHLNTIGWTG